MKVVDDPIKLLIDIYLYDSTDVPESKKQDRYGQTLIQHEMEHARKGIMAWNALVFSVIMDIDP